MNIWQQMLRNSDISKSGGYLHSSILEEEDKRVRVSGLVFFNYELRTTNYELTGGLAQLARASALQAECQGFESLSLPQPSLRAK